MSSAAQREDRPEQDAPLGQVLGNGTDGAVALRQIAAERLAAHRQRRAVADAPQGHRDQITGQAAAAFASRGRSGVSRVRDAVAARYQESPSYREFLAAEAERALQQARAEAEVAARNAVAVEQAQRQLMEEIEQWNQPVAGPVAVEPLPAVEPETVAVQRRRAVVETEPTRLKVQLYSDLPPALGVGPIALRDNAVVEPNHANGELEELDQEIAFRLAPEFQSFAVETQPIQANIIEFPRQLVASRKARPRLAEGPLREDGTPEPQLRIFEVEPEQISVEPVAVEAAGAPEWQSLLLATAPLPAAAVDAVAEPHQPTIALHPAPVSRRMLAATVDAVCIGAAMVGFGAVVAEIAGPALRDLTLPMLGGAAAGTLAVFVLLYKLLFFTLNDSTPGMWYARIGMCTFRDSNPTRRSLRRRLFWTVLAVCPLGMGLMWLLLDSDRMGWHDRMSRMYPRAY